MRNSGPGRTPGGVLNSLGSDNEENGTAAGRNSLHSSQAGSFLDREPVFESGGSSDSESDYAPTKPVRQPVSVVWQDVSVEVKEGRLKKGTKALLKNVSGFAEPRSILAIVGPFGSGKSALVNLIGGRLRGSASVTGSMSINGKGVRESWVRPTCLGSRDEPLANVSVEQALVYTALLHMPDTGSGELEEEVRQICLKLGLMGDLQKSTNQLDYGAKRRLTVACQLICCSSLIVMEDVLMGVQEGCALAIMRTVNELTKDGCTAILAVGQPTTDICAFFSRAYILVNGEVVYFGDTGVQAMKLLSSAGMPCPPLYSPVEQYIRLVDSTFEVYLQAQGSSGFGVGDDWNAQFSAMMFKVLQNTYNANDLNYENQQQANRLSSAVYEPFKDKTSISPFRQYVVLCRRLVTQGLQGLPLYLGRIIFSIIISLAYGGTYWKLNYSYLAAEQRTTVLFIVAAVIPATAIGTLPFYRNGALVFRRESQRCRLGIWTHFAALFTLTLPHLAVAAAFSAVALIPMVKLNDTGAGWGYFILNATMAQMCADAMILAVATIVPQLLSYQVGLVLFVVQAISSGFFPGSNRGLNLPVSAVSFIAWSFRGLLQNEFLYRDPQIWSCPAAGVVDVQDRVALCSLENRVTYDILAQDIALKTRSRWNAIYVLLGIYAFWTILYLLALMLRGRRGKACPGSTINFQVPTVVNPIHSQETGGPVHQGKRMPAQI